MRIPGALLLAILVVSSEARGAGPASAPSCGAASVPADWVAGLLSVWWRLGNEVLGLESVPLPPLVLFDLKCVHRVSQASPGLAASAADPVLQLGGWAVSIDSRPHEDRVALPNGKLIEARPMAFASLVESPAAQDPFFVLALPEVWRRFESKSAQLDLDSFLLGVAVHELTHTLQLPAVSRRIDELRALWQLPEEIHDTTIDAQFADRPDFAADRERERRAWLEAARSADPDDRRDLAERALALRAQRIDRYFSGEASAWSEVEDLLVGLEGTAIWAHFEAARRYPAITFLPERPELRERSELLAALADKGGQEWVQDVGLPVVLLLSEQNQDWRRLAFSGEPFRPFVVLEVALRRAGSAGSTAPGSCVDPAPRALVGARR